jgi:hypothetical protein
MNGLPIVRIALMILMIRDKKNRSTYRKALRNRAVLEALTVELSARAELQLGGIGDGSFMEFFQWLLDNWEEILKIIMLFMANEGLA